jgi:hypothetical protein
MIGRTTSIGICVAALSLILATSALAGPAGSEYLPKVPQSGASSSAEPTGTTSLPQSESTKKSKEQDQKRKKKQRKASTVPPPSSDDDDSSGSVLLSPVVLLMVVGVIVIVVGMTMRRRRSRSLKHRAEKRQGTGPSRGARPTPKGEIIGGGGGDRAS